MIAFKSVLLAAALGMAMAGAALAAEVEVKLLNKGADGPMVFEPAYVAIQPGDTVKFVAVDKAHNAEGIPGMIPEGEALLKGPMSQDFAATFTKEGVYGIRCAPHYGMGMVALVVVGADRTNLDQAKAVKHLGKAKARFDALFAQLK